MPIAFLLPAASLIADANGNLFGTAANAGGVGSCNVYCGSVFELSLPASKGGRWGFTVLYDFKGGRDGGLPQGNLIFGPGGSLYGTANVGGKYGKFGLGVVFQLKPSGRHWKEIALHSFGRGTDGRNPHGGLVSDAKGNLLRYDDERWQIFRRHRVRTLTVEQSGEGPI